MTREDEEEQLELALARMHAAARQMKEVKAELEVEEEEEEAEIGRTRKAKGGAQVNAVHVLDMIKNLQEEIKVRTTRSDRTFTNKLARLGCRL